VKYFTDEELNCNHCGLIALHPGFDDDLIALREAFNEPMKTKSCCRCKAHNDSDAVKGHQLSLHIGDLPAHADKGQKGTLAIDIETPDGPYRGRLFDAAWRLGWSIGWNAKLKFLHLDRRDRIGMKQTTFDYGP
jgi:hypothetical protein